MSSEALTIIGQTDIQRGGQGIDFANKLFSLQPATLSIVQNMSDAVSEGVPPGMLYIKDTKQSFKEMKVALLAMPREQRDYHEGEKKTKDTLMCYSRDMERPDDRATAPQAMSCAGCSKSDWTSWRNSPLPNVQKRNLIPKCEISYYALFIDTEYRLPLQMWIRGASKSPFEAAMKNLSRTLYMMKAKGIDPNIFDVTFTLSSEPGNQKNHVIKMKNFAAITPEDREAFGDVYLSFTNRRANAQAAEAQQAADAQQAASVEEEFNTAGPAPAVAPAVATGPIEGEYVTI